MLAVSPRAGIREGLPGRTGKKSLTSWSARYELMSSQPMPDWTVMSESASRNSSTLSIRERSIEMPPYGWCRRRPGEPASANWLRATRVNPRNSLRRRTAVMWPSSDVPPDHGVTGILYLVYRCQGRVISSCRGQVRRPTRAVRATTHRDLHHAHDVLWEGREPQSPGQRLGQAGTELQRCARTCALGPDDDGRHARRMVGVWAEAVRQ